MNLRFLFPVLIVICGLAAQAEGSRQCRGGRPSEAERKQWMTEMIQYKHDFMGRELELSDAQKEQFFSVYDKLESERWKLEREARKMEQEVRQKELKPLIWSWRKLPMPLLNLKGNNML